MNTYPVLFRDNHGYVHATCETETLSTTHYLKMLECPSGWQLSDESSMFTCCFCSNAAGPSTAHGSRDTLSIDRVDTPAVTHGALLCLVQPTLITHGVEPGDLWQLQANGLQLAVGGWGKRGVESAVKTDTWLKQSAQTRTCIIFLLWFGVLRNKQKMVSWFKQCTNSTRPHCNITLSIDMSYILATGPTGMWILLMEAATDGNSWQAHFRGMGFMKNIKFKLKEKMINFHW